MTWLMSPCTTSTESTTFKTVTFLRKNQPNTAPVKNAVSVNPGKYAPTGNKIAETTSPIAPTNPPATGP